MQIEAGAGKLRATCLCLLAFALLFGCNGAPDSPTAEPKGSSSSTQAAEAVTPESKLHEQLSSGAYQSGAAVDSIVDAINKTNLLLSLVKDTAHKDAATEIRTLLESAGQGISDFTEPPEIQAVKADFAANDDLRLKAIEAANDALFEVQEAGGILDSLMPELKNEASSASVQLHVAITSVIDDLTGAIEAFGGKVEVGL